MGDTDRLAALLDDALSAMDDEWTVREVADVLLSAGVGFRDERLREDGEGGYFIQTPVRHYPSGFVVLAGHPQLGGQFCKEDGGDWPCAAVRAAIAREYAKETP